MMVSEWGIFITNLSLDSTPPWYWYASILITSGFYIAISLNLY